MQCPFEVFFLVHFEKLRQNQFLHVRINFNVQSNNQQATFARRCYSSRSLVIELQFLHTPLNGKLWIVEISTRNFYPFTHFFESFL